MSDNDNKSRGGERQGVRDTMDRLTRRLVESGVPAEKAEQTARKTALRDERGAVRIKR